jgi:cytidylate kinase
MESYQIAIDGPASAGKSTIAKILAKNLKFMYIDTGAMYRAITLAAKNENIDFNDDQKVKSILDDQEITFLPGDPVQKVFLNGKDVTDAIRLPEVTNNVSAVSSLPSVRNKLVDFQRKLAEGNSVIMDGRDIGTTVLPQADLKIFLVASVDERATRRYKENQIKGIDTDLDTLKAEIIQRDYKDSHRELSPLKKADDAIEVDTSGLTIPQVVQKITSLIRK